MAIKIVQVPTTLEYDLHGIALDLSRKTGVLIRQSKKGADLESRESRLRQESLVPVAALLRGDPDRSNIILYDEGSGVSGTKGYDQRPQLSRLYMDIANGVVGSIVVARADRLFRDKHFRNVSMFTELAERKRIIVIVPGRTVYDFTKTKDLQAFQREMQEAYSYIATQVAYMVDTRKQKIRRGLYGGGNLPAPYAILRAADKDQRVPVIYTPWHKIAICLFERLRDYDFLLSRIAHYIDEQPYIFPYPPAEDLQRYLFITLMRQVAGGYTFSSSESIRRYFSNLVLGGYANIGRDSDGNVLFLANAFEPAIPWELLSRSYAAIRGHYPDGTPFEQKRLSIRTHAKKPSLDESQALLHGLLDSENGQVFYYGFRHSTVNVPAYACNKDMMRDGQVLKGRTRIIQRDRAWSVACEELDRIVVTRLCALAQYDGDMSSRIKAFWDRRKADEVNQARLLKLQIKAAKAQILRYDELLTKPAAPLSPETERRYIEALRETEEDLQRLRTTLAKHQTEYQDPTDVVANFYDVLSDLPHQFALLSMETQKRVARQVIRDIRLNMISTHLFLLRIQWQNGIAVCPDVALIWRGKGARIGYAWAPEEDEVIKACYPYLSQEEIMQALPRRAWQSIREHAFRLGLRRINYQSGPAGNNHYHLTMSYDDLEAVTKLVTDPAQQERLREVANQLAQHTVKGELTAHWWLPLYAISYAGNASFGEDVALLLGEAPVAQESRAEPDELGGQDGFFTESLGPSAYR
jgi:DNA invertase Pin-like site-specific DNA recombinase